MPLATAPYRWFAAGDKTWELRRYGRQYTEAQLVVGRRVELRRGYSDPTQALWGTVQELWRAESVAEFFDAVPYDEVIPVALCQAEAERMALAILGERAEVIGFRVRLDATM